MGICVECQPRWKLTRLATGNHALIVSLGGLSPATLTVPCQRRPQTLTIVGLAEILCIYQCCEYVIVWCGMEKKDHEKVYRYPSVLRPDVFSLQLKGVPFLFGQSVKIFVLSARWCSSVSITGSGQQIPRVTLTSTNQMRKGGFM